MNTVFYLSWSYNGLLAQNIKRDSPENFFQVSAELSRAAFERWGKNSLSLASRRGNYFSIAEKGAANLSSQSQAAFFLSQFNFNRASDALSSPCGNFSEPWAGQGSHNSE